MTLAEKILSLRTQRGMSQDDLAEKLEVSRQSVSKWETAQSTPDLDKIIKLANLFGVTVDELVREGEAPQPPEPPQPQVIYVEQEKRGLSPVQVLGVVTEVTGVALAIIGIMGAPLLIFAAVALVVLGLPLLLAKKHPWLILGWLAVALSLVVFNPYTSVTPWGLIEGIWLVYIYITHNGVIGPSALLGFGIAIVRGIVVLILIVFTGRACGKAWKEKRFPEQK